MKSKYLTTPIYYVNAKPHIGHYYTTMLADTLKRHYMQRGYAVTFLTGTDEHGEKIEQMAAEAGKPPQMFADEIAAVFRDTWEQLNLNFDIFFRTTQKDHAKKVQTAVQRLKDRGDIVFREYSGNYCVGCERFLTSSEVNAEGLCPDHLRKPEPRSEANYFFLMSKYQQALIDYIDQNPEWIEPKHYRNEVLSFLKQPLGDLCISRPKTRLTWGIDLPFDDKYVIYVWFDALLNYTNALGWPDDFDADLWRSCIHLVGKDILKTHAVYWPTMLMALGIPQFAKLQVGGYWLSGDHKMSKSLGNVLRPLDVEAQYGTETLRFYLLKDMAYGQDASFSENSYVACINAHLANGIGNLVSRVLTLCAKNEVKSFDPSTLTDKDRTLLALRRLTLDAWDRAFEECKYQNAIKAWCELVSSVDFYINEMKPWALAKQPESRADLERSLCVSLQMIEALAIMIYPVLPQAAGKILAALGLGQSMLATATDVDRTSAGYGLTYDVPKLFMRVTITEETT